MTYDGLCQDGFFRNMTYLYRAKRVRELIQRIGLRWFGEFGFHDLLMNKVLSLGFVIIICSLQHTAWILMSAGT